MADKLRLAVFVSGGGSNLQAIMDACASDSFPARVVAVVSNNPHAFAIERAKKANVPALVIDHKDFASRQEHEREIVRQLRPFKPDMGVLAGYMRIVTPVLLDYFRAANNDRPGLLNIHPADTRQYQGAHGYEFALGMDGQSPGRLDETKITVHFVDAGMDTGPVIKQAMVRVLPDDTLEDLKSRGLEVEHELYPEVIAMVAQGRVRVVGSDVEIIN